MSYPYQQPQGPYPSQPGQQWGGQPQQQWGQPPPTGGPGGQPPMQGGGQWQGQPPTQGGGQWQGGPPTQGGGQWPGQPGQQWGGQPQQQWGQPPPTGGQPGGYPQQGYTQPGSMVQGPPPGSFHPPAQPPSGFQGWYTQYYNQMSPQEMQQVRQWFMNMDRDRSGSISANELANVAIGGIPLGLETAMSMIRVFDVDKNGTIDFYEYASLHKFLLSMQALFQQQDRDRNGRLDINETGAALTAGGFRLAPVAMQSLFRKYNKTGQGITMVEFLALIGHVARVKSLFEWRDTQKAGKVTLDMDALLEMTSEF